ncbi:MULTISPECIES: hypothetical protein [unclassified Cryobacterium]|uniref:hypothetical protein n=1 Tax=unclassified Cryobacterium TaxID=2649013 RepID=UPI002AB4FA16|nr:MULTISPECIES: hypothetical protein [unclassified Cryobacterium]MDY7557989.1 hypothetical protein [Cryobacterium sp. 10C3]MEB0202962.1 hypothetical protein [Cryobacterium sp. 5I3]MEB0287535.1 hypothetical protein [Cryobacterium sp. 10S3]MEB0305110.1 hypothetical protein [Cryobacterium sp. 10I1]
MTTAVAAITIRCHRGRLDGVNPDKSLVDSMVTSNVWKAPCWSDATWRPSRT